MVVGLPCWSSGAEVRSPAFGPRCGSGGSCSSDRGIWPWEGLLASLRRQVAVLILVRCRACTCGARHV